MAAMVFGSAWFSVFLYGWSVLRMALERGTATALPRFLWSLGCAFILIHWLTAFEIFYDWDHQRALERTRLRTEALTGVNTGLGLFVNYILVLIWVVDLGWWWMVGEERYRQRSKKLTGLLHGFFLFMVINSAVVFVSDWKRWLGLGIFAVALGSVVILLQRSTSKAPTPVP